MEQVVRGLRPGQYVWMPQASPSGPVIIIVALARQRAYVFRNGVLIGVSTASTGKAGHVTPTGVFTVLQKQIDHKSNLYSDAPMPFMQRLTWDGIALHAGNLPGYPASHGCIRLPLAFAKSLYRATNLGLTVVITNQQDIPRIAPSADVLTHAGIAAATGEANDWTWRPAVSPSGPLSILVSAADRRLTVLRNGVEIGSSPVEIGAGPLPTAAYSLRDIDQAGFHWVRLPLPGDSPRIARDLSIEERQRLRMPEAFRARLAAALIPGTTVVVTADTLASSGSATPLRLIEAQP